MTWRDTWRETVESFLREMRDPDEEPSRPSADPIVSAIAGARSEVSALEGELRVLGERLQAEYEAVQACERRLAMARRIGDDETVRLATTFGRRHSDRAQVLERKRDVLRDELALARLTLNELLDFARSEQPADER